MISGSCKRRTDGMLLYLILATLLEGIWSVKLTYIEVPSHVPIGRAALLKCNYTLGKDELYSVKWYKDKDEFYRYVPKDKPPGQVFGMQGDKVNLSASTDKQVSLENVDLSTTGVYRCEVSADAPSFHTVAQAKMMMIVDPPDEGPKITGGRPKYRVGDTVRVNCSSVGSSPAALLEWFVNGKKVKSDVLREYPSIKHRDGLASSILGLEFRVSEQHFDNGGMTLRCVASIEPIYTVSNEQSVMGDLLTESALESRGSLSHVRTNNRATAETSTAFLSLSWTLALLQLLLLR